MIDREKIEYVKNTLTSLKALALEQNSDMLAYLIQVAETEAEDVLDGRFARSTSVPGQATTTE